MSIEQTITDPRLDIKVYWELGYRATKRKSEDLRHFSNAAEAAAKNLAGRFNRLHNQEEFAEAVTEAQQNTNTDLSAMLQLDAQAQKVAIAAFVGGCYAFAAEDMAGGKSEATDPEPIEPEE